MAASRSGLIGLSVAGHVMEELKIAIVHAPAPLLQTEEETAVDWDELTSHGHVTHIGAQVNDLYYLERNQRVILTCSHNGGSLKHFFSLSDL